jgi:putative ABC transport system substrate-binding protein
MKRRAFISLLGGVAVLPVAARAQAMPVIGFLSSGTLAGEQDRTAIAFRQGLAEIGYVDGRNVQIDYRWAEGGYDRLLALAADLADRRVAVIAALGTPAAPAAKAATATIPIVFRIGVDPVALGLVASLNRPGGNLTGVVSLNVELEPKRLEVLHQLVPTAKLVAVLINPTSLNAETIKNQVQAAARVSSLQLHVLYASTERDLDIAFATLVRLRADALTIGTDPFFNNRSEQLAGLALRHGVPTISATRGFTAAGGLVSYGGSDGDSYALTGAYTGRVLKGEKPADLPVQQATKVELTLNLKTAKSFGLTVPLALLTRADEVIE